MSDNKLTYKAVTFDFCPICKSEVRVRSDGYARSNYDTDSYYVVECPNCHVQMKSGSTYYKPEAECKKVLEELANRWNNRV